MAILQGVSETWRDGPGYLDNSPFFPNPFSCVKDMAITGWSELISRLPWNGIGVWLDETWEILRATVTLDATILLMPFVAAFVFTVVRVILNYLIFKPFPKKYNLEAESEEKFPESIWKFLVYTVTWSWAIYLVTKENYFTDLASHWTTWAPTETIDPALTALYIVQIGFYLHCAYATLYIETIRKDVLVLTLHHFLTIGLLLFSYVVRFHRIGLLVLFYHDIGDVLLELAKCFNYFQVQGGKPKWLPEMAANITFGIFTIQHVLFRLYWFPTKCIYSAMHVSMQVYPNGPYYMLFVPMLWALYAMQVYWFKFILRLVYKILILGDKMKDTREIDEENKIKENGERKVKADGPRQGDARKRQTGKREDQ